MEREWQEWVALGEEQQAEPIPIVFLAGSLGSVLLGGLTPSLLPGVRGWHLPRATRHCHRTRAQCWCGSPRWAGLSHGPSKPGVNDKELNENCSRGCSGLVTSREAGQVWVGAGGMRV